MALAAALEPAADATAPARGPRKRGAAGSRAAVTALPSHASQLDPEAGATPADAEADEATAAVEDELGPRAVPATERRRAVERLLGLWLEVARDVVLVRGDGARSVRDTVLLEELAAVAAAVPPGSAEAFLDHGARAAELLAANVSPELILDSIVLAWPRRAGAAA